MNIYKSVNHLGVHQLRSLLKEIEVNKNKIYVDPVCLSELSEFWKIFFIGSGSIPPCSSYDSNTDFSTFFLCMDILHNSKYTYDNELVSIKIPTFKQLLDIINTLDMWLIPHSKISELLFVHSYHTRLIKILLNNDIYKECKLLSLLKESNGGDRGYIEMYLDEDYSINFFKEIFDIDKYPSCHIIWLLCHRNTQFNLEGYDLDIFLSNINNIKPEIKQNYLLMNNPLNDISDSFSFTIDGVLHSFYSYIDIINRVKYSDIENKQNQIESLFESYKCYY